jgi:hypothetical protein
VPTHPCVWARPPLFSDLMLDDVPMQTHLNIPTTLRVDDLEHLYDEFISGFLYSKQRSVKRDEKGNVIGGPQPSDVWLQKELKLPTTVAGSLFTRAETPKERLGLHMNLVQFAALVAYNNRPSSIERGPETFVVNVSTATAGFSFGVRDGRLVSNLKVQRREIPCRGLFCRDGLENLHYGEMGRSEEPNLLDTMKTWAAQQTPRLGDRGRAMHLGVQILWWRSFGRNVPGRLQLLTSPDHSTQALIEACEQARGYADYERPQFILRSIFAPFFRVADLDQMFGETWREIPTPIPERVRQRWDWAINSIDPAFSGTAQQQGEQRAEEASQSVQA